MNDTTPLPADVTDDDIWRRAKRAEMKRMAIAGASVAVLVFALSALDPHHWPPRLRQPLGDVVSDGALAAAVCLVAFGVVVYIQKIQAPERYVSPLRALDGDERRAATTAIDTAQPSSNARLRHIEILRAKQLKRTAPASIGSALASSGILLVAAAMMFWAHTPVIGVGWILIAGVTARRGLTDHRRGRAARQYLARLADSPPDDAA